MTSFLDQLHASLSPPLPPPLLTSPLHTYARRVTYRTGARGHPPAVSTGSAPLNTPMSSHREVEMDEVDEVEEMEEVDGAEEVDEGGGGGGGGGG